MKSTATKQGWWLRRPLHLPGIRMLAGYRAAWLPNDIAGGATVFAVLVPSALAYGSLAGLDPVTGLYTALAAMAVYAFVGSSRQLIIGPDAALPLLVAATVAPFATDAAHYAALVATLSLMTGAWCVVAASLRVGGLIHFMPRPILTGYIIGVALTVIASQLGKFFGFSLQSQWVPGQLWEAAWRWTEIHGLTLGLGLLCLGVLVAFRRFWPRVPGPVVVMVGATVAVAVLRLDERGVAVVGSVPAGLPTLVMPAITAETLRGLVVPALSMALLSFADELMTARSFAAKHAYAIDPNQELVALGVANIASGVLGGFPTSASSARTAILDSLDAKTQLAGLVSCGLLILFLLFFTSWLADLPIVVLAAILVMAVVGLIDIRELRRLYAIRAVECWLALSTAAAALILGLLEAMGVALMLAVLGILHQIARPHDVVLGTREGDPGVHERQIDTSPPAQLSPGLVMYRFDAPLCFANAPYFLQRVRRLVASCDPPLRWLVIDAETISTIDVTAAEMLLELVDELTAQGIQVCFARAHGSCYELLRRTGVVERIGDACVFPLIQDAITAFRSRSHTAA